VLTEVISGRLRGHLQNAEFFLNSYRGTASRTWITQFLGVTSGWAGVTITKFFTITADCRKRLRNLLLKSSSFRNF
jgi:hypothetical protein